MRQPGRPGVGSDRPRFEGPIPMRAPLREAAWDRLGPADPAAWLDPATYRPPPRRRRRPRLGPLPWLLVLAIAAVMVANVLQPVLRDLTEEPAHIAGPRRLPPHRVRAVTRPGVWSELEVTDGPEGTYRGQWIHAVRGYLFVKGRCVCARPKLYLNGRLWIRGYYRCGYQKLWFIAWSSTREMPWYGPDGAVFELVWTDRWSRAHPRYKWQ